MEGSMLIIATLARLVERVRRERRIGRDIAELSSYDDQLLRDIGIRRGEIRGRLRFGDAGRITMQSTASAPADDLHAALMSFPSASDWR
jgi:uncharacterized protein YjiS (DUF1127 family)